MTEVPSLQPLALFGGLNAEELWFLVDASIVHWLVLVLLPKWKYTPKVTLIVPMAMALVYTLLIFSVTMSPTSEPDPEAGFTSLKGIVAIFRDPTNVFIGWVHYIVFDGLVARWIVLDSVERGATTSFHIVAVVPCLFFTLMSGPFGLLVYVVLIRTLLDEEAKAASSSTTTKKD